jgi:hypothetical protein
MFKTNITLVNENWDLILQYKSRNIPSIDDYIYVESRYHKVITVIHLPDTPNITIVIKEHGGFSKI